MMGDKQMNISQRGRRTNLSLNEIALVLTELNALNFPSMQSQGKPLPKKLSRDYLAVRNAVTKANQTNKSI